MSALERLQDLLARRSKGKWRTAPLFGNEIVLDEDGQLVAGRSAFGLDVGRANARLIALAPVLASDLIALAEAAMSIYGEGGTWAGFETVDGELTHDGDCNSNPADDYMDCDCGLRAGNRAIRAALSTVLVHIDDSLPEVDREGEGRTVHTFVPIEGALEGVEE